jgi:exodeoxyribonuclease V alpha subunit
VQLDPSQSLAVDLACTAPFCIITGGPGTGKSTCMRVAIDRMEAAGERVALASPTGKAAKRLSEATGRHASTIHRLLEWRGVFQRNSSNPLDCDVVIIDEASMLDASLCDDLVSACKPETRVVFVGDVNQLPSVGPGRVLGDLVDSGDVPVARLTHVHRAAMESWVCRNAPKVLSGEPLELDEHKDFAFYQCEEGADVTRRIVALATAGQLEGAQVLTPQRTGACGVVAINKALQLALNPPDDTKAEWVFGTGEDAKVLRIGDKVLQTANNYTLEVFNGEVGTVDYFESSGVMHVDFGDRVVSYQKNDAFALDLAYSLTIHKSQGSEFPWAVVVCHSTHTFMLDRNLLYTAITRAKKGVILVGDRKGLKAAIDQKDPPKRNTKLVERMREILHPEQAAAAAPEVEPDPPPKVTVSAKSFRRAPAPANTNQQDSTDDIPF